MPGGTRPEGDGGWLAYDANRARVYAARGNKRSDFYEYDPAQDSWIALSPWPAGAEGRSPGRGSAGCADGSGNIYATKGHNTRGFYKYLAATDSWTQLTDVPLGITNKKVTGGTDLVYVPGVIPDSDYVYLLKGYKNEFWRYNPVRDSWYSLADAPAARYDRGSWLALDYPSGTVYAHQAKYHVFYPYDLGAQTWGAVLVGMPFVGGSGRSKKSKDGGSAAWFDNNIYALKGGNTQEFWRFTPSSGAWVELETIPQMGTAGKNKKVKTGGDITATENGLCALKGNKTDELWQYTPWRGFTSWPGREGTMGGPSPLRDARMAICPNPLRQGFVTISVTGLKRSSGPVTVGVYNAAGRLVRHWLLPTGHRSLALDFGSMSTGVYLVKLGSHGLAATQKLVVQR